MFYVLIFCLSLAVIIYFTQTLDLKGTLLAFFMALILLYLRNIMWFFLLLVFYILGVIATKFYSEKKKTFNKPFNGMRTEKNVFGNGFFPLVFALLNLPFAFSASIATALADTFASEIGILSKNTYLITTFEKVKPGTEGGISILGEIIALIGSGIIAVFYVYLFSNFVQGLIIFFSGFIGCQIDSLLGATFERKGHLNKTHVNLIATFLGGLIAFLMNFFIF